ncbi:hypothetical protein QWT69_06910 [Sporosarcina oncorhynchi]|uniref:Uncharacterized protein n=1 Tax=Sporosarcina oncorhynchi TaxID=3056444 RepID=A0ABZ0L8K2_9BACL|nr:hypothetical protein [Sporosarcina sp. T2O-4]WOV88830.1 hypothetical protein QWT69_06910 [Sporosarcina sp. T2O-4]
MNAQRKKIIMTEINYWKSNKLLPEHYCDFLITLYTQGEEDSKVDISDAVLVKEKKSMNVTIMLFLLTALLSGIALFFITEYPTVTLSIAALFTISILIKTMFGKTARSGLNSFLYIIAAFMLLLISLKIWTVFFIGQPTLLVGLLILNCMLWLLAGRLLKLLYFTLSGAGGLLLIIAFIFKTL